MYDDDRIFLDDESPEPTSPTGFWIAFVVLLIAVGTFVIAGRERPDADLAVITIPAPVPTTTSLVDESPIEEPVEPLLLEDWVPNFDRSLLLVSIEDDGVATTEWRRGSSPVTNRHTLGTVTTVEANASGTALAVVTKPRDGVYTLWLGDHGGFELALAEQELLNVAFHDIDATLLAASITLDETTILLSFSTESSEPLRTVAVDDLPGGLVLRAWSDQGFFLTALDDPTSITWIKPDETREVLEGFVDLGAGATMLRAGGDIRVPAAAPIDGQLVELPDGTVSLSPDQNLVVVDAPNRRDLLNRDTGLTLPLTDSPTFAADWSADSRWLTYVSAIEVYRQGRLTRFVFVDAVNGSSTSISLRDEELPRPDVMVVGP